MRARYFNNIALKDDIVTKSSTDIYKIKSEFNYYYLLPDDLKPFFVKPFNYRETENEAMYDMKYSGITLYEFIKNNTNGFFSKNEEAFNIIIEQLKKYFETRKKYNKVKESSDNFVYSKVLKRIDNFKKLPEYYKIDNFLKANDLDLDDIVNKFKSYYQCLPSKVRNSTTLTIAHGDLHFSNILVNEETFEIKFIDVKGSTNKEGMYIDEYYDLAKLYHSIEGIYDFIINDNYEIVLNDNLDNYKIQINMSSSKHKEIYKSIYDNVYSELSHNDKEIIRIYTASLFLSMLPLHKDNLKRILAFIKISLLFLDNELQITK